MAIARFMKMPDRFTMNAHRANSIRGNTGGHATSATRRPCLHAIPIRPADYVPGQFLHHFFILGAISRSVDADRRGRAEEVTTMNFGSERNRQAWEKLTPEQQAAVMRIKERHTTPEYRAEEARIREEVRKEIPPKKRPRSEP